MGRIETSLHASYQANEWGALEGVREMISNAIDGQVRFKHLGIGKMTISYDPFRLMLTIRNDGVTVPTKALLMGTSESRGDDRAIGQFGEGLPMGLLALVRAGHAVEIENGKERWRPGIDNSKNFNGEAVLFIDVRQLRIERDHFQVQISGIKSDFYMKEVRGMFLHMDPAFDGAQAVLRYGGTYAQSPAEGFNQEMVLLQPHMMGRIYNKGVYVTSRDDLMYGYNLTGELNRDRKHMDEWSLKSSLDDLLARCIANNVGFMSQLVDTLFDEGGSLEGSNSYSGLRHNDTFVSKMTEKFTSKYGPDAFPAADDNEEKRVQKIGRRSARVSTLVAETVCRKLGTLSELEAAQAQKADVHTIEALTNVERYNFLSTRALISSARPKFLSATVAPATFAGSDVRFTVNGTQVLVARSKLLSFSDALNAMASAAVRFCPAEDYESNAEKLLTTVVTRLVEGDSALSMALLSIQGRK